jgi:integrase/recombinase XerC
MPSTALTPAAGGTPLARAAHWTELPPDARHRRAAEAANSRDAAALCELMEAALLLGSRSGAHVSRYTLRNYRQGVRALLAAWPHENLLRPSRDAGRLVLRQWESAELSASTVQVRLAACRALYVALRWSGATEADPFKDARAAKDPTPAHAKRKPYSDSDLARLVEAASGLDRVLVLLAGHAGLRAAECCALRWADVDLAARRLTVLAGKGRKRRVVPIGRTLRAALGAVQQAVTPDPAALVLPYRSTEQARRHLRSICAAAGVEPLGLHAARHTAGTRLVRESGGKLEVARDLLGHSSISTTSIYSHLADDAVQRAVEGW